MESDRKDLKSGKLPDTDPRKRGRKRGGSAHVQARLATLRIELAKMPLTPGALVRKYAKAWGIGERQVLLYLERIRRECVEDHAAAAPTLREEMVLQVKHHYARCMAKGAMAAAGKALDRLISLQGLDAPRRIELSGRDGAAIPVRREYKVDGLDEAKVDLLLEVLGEVEASGSAASNEGEKQEVGPPKVH